MVDVIAKAEDALQDALARLSGLQRHIYDYSRTHTINGFTEPVLAMSLKLPLNVIEAAVCSRELRCAWDAADDVDRARRTVFCEALTKLCNKHKFAIGQAIVDHLDAGERIVYSTFEDNHLYLSSRITQELKVENDRSVTA